jgi:hypothetical protein
MKASVGQRRQHLLAISNLFVVNIKYSVIRPISFVLTN